MKNVPLYFYVILMPLETGMNTLTHSYKLCHINLTTSPLYLVKQKIAQKQPMLTAVRSVEPTVPNFHRVVHCSFPCLLEKFSAVF